MIDTVTVAWISDLAQVPRGMTRMKGAEDRPPRFGVSRQDGALFVTYEPSSRMITLRISVARWVGGGAINWPLVPLRRGVEDLRLGHLAEQVGAAIGIPTSRFGSKLSASLPSFAVTKVSYALDVEIQDPVGTARACMEIQRRHGGRLCAWASSGRSVSTAQWGKHRRFQVYAKGVELADVQRDLEAAARARSVLRLEATYETAEAVRDGLLWGEVTRGCLPSLGGACLPWVVHRTLWFELYRMRMFDELAEDVAPDATDGFPSRLRRAVSVIRDARADLAAGRRASVGRRKSFTDERVGQLVQAFSLASAGYTAREINGLVGWSPRALSELLSELRELGLPPDSTYGGTLTETMRELREAVATAFPDVEEPATKKYPWPLAVRSPWGNGHDIYTNARVEGERAVKQARAEAAGAHDLYADDIGA